ncbi:hypothetical protein D3C87_1578430 [compost metagenome]
MGLEDLCLSIPGGLVTQLLQRQGRLSQGTSELLALSLRSPAGLAHLKRLLGDLHHLTKARPR